MAFLAQKLISASGAKGDPVDDDFNLVTGLYHFDGSNGGQNNTFTGIGPSGASQAWTRNNTPSQGTFSPFSAEDGKWSVQFPGSTTSDQSRIALSSTNEYVFGTGDFTIEAWIFPQSALTLPNANFILDFRNGNAGYNINVVMYIAYNSSTSSYNLYGWTGNAASGITLNAWNHVAIVRESGEEKGFVNGVEKYSASETSNHQYSGSGVNIGNRYASTWGPFDGFISNVRIVKGTAVYTGNFTPSTSPLTNVTNTVNLGLRSNRFVDSVSSVVPYLNTTSGPIKIQPFSPFAPSAAYDAAVNGGSGSFTRSNEDYINATSSNHAIGTSDFTIECWCYLTDGGHQYGNGVFAPTTGVVGPALGQWNNTGWQIYCGTSETNISNSGFRKNEWVHVAFVRASNVVNVYQNGVKVTSNISDSTNYTNTGFNIGWYYGTAYAWDGFISNFKMSLNAIYTSAFTPPTALVTPTSGGSSAASTKILIDFTNAAIIDSSQKTNLLTVGNAQLDTSVKKFGTASAEFDGTNDYLEAGPTVISPQRGSWTYECFIYPKTVVDAGGYGCIFSTQTSSPNTDGVALYYISSTKKLECYGPAAGGTYFSTANDSITLDQWQHVALVFDLDATNYPITCYVNGTSVGSSTTNTWYTRDSGLLKIGAQHDGGLEFTGFIDEFRISLKARYTSNFTAPTKEFPNL